MTGDIFKQTSVYIELEKITTNRYQLSKVIRKYPAFDDLQDQQYDRCITKEEIMEEC